MLKTFLSILAELCWPPIYLVSPRQFENTQGIKRHGERVKGNWGISADFYPMISTVRGMRGKMLKNTLWHEIGHKIHSSKPHWWIYLFGDIMADGGNQQTERSVYYGHTRDELPSRERLLHLSILAAKRYNKKIEQ